MQPRLPLALLLAACLAAACDEDTAGGSTCSSVADLTPILAQTRAGATEVGSALLLRVDQVRAALEVARAEADPTASTESLQTHTRSLLETFAQYEPLAYGPDGAAVTVARVNPFPLDEAAVSAYLTDGAASFPDGPPAFDRGLPALEYAVFDSSLAAAGALDDPDLDTVLSRIERELTASVASWEAAEDFADDTGTAAGSSFSVLVNALSRHFEDMRRDRLGIPAGVALGFPNPQTVQAPHAAMSLALLREGVEASRGLYVGYAAGQHGIRDYLRGIDSPDARSLADDIDAQYDAILAGLSAVDEPLSAAVADGGDAEDVQAAYNALSRQVVDLKTDLPAVTCVAITYVDNPSDSD